MPVLSPVDAWLTLAADLSLPDLVAVADFLVTGLRGVGALASMEALEEVVAQHAGTAGVDRARRALRFVRRGAWSRPESLVRFILARAGLPEPVLNEPVDTSGGAAIVPDIAFPEFRVAVEYNGIHHDDSTQKVKDLRRVDTFAELSWSVVNVERTELFSTPSSVVARTVHRLRERGWPGGRRSIDMTKKISLEP